MSSLLCAPFLSHCFRKIKSTGKLGVVVDSPPGGGAAYVSEVKDDSPLRNKIKLGDRITAVDGEDVRGLKAIHVSSEYIG